MSQNCFNKIWLLALCFSVLTLTGAITPVEGRPFKDWAMVYRGQSLDEGFSVDETLDGGFVVAGWTASSGAGGSDALVLRLDSRGRVIWQKTFGGAGDDAARWIRQTSQGGFIVAGWTVLRGNPFDADAWIIRLDPEGNVLWQRTLGGLSNDGLISIEETSDGGFVATGGTGSFGAGRGDLLVVRLDGLGNVIWQRAYGGPVVDFGEYVHQLADGGFVVAGETNSYGTGALDGWILRLDASGDVLWQKAYGGIFDEQIRMVRGTQDGGFIAAGFIPRFGAYDLWVFKLDGFGNVLWQKAYGGPGSDFGVFLGQVAEGGFIVAGSTDSFSGGSADAWLVRLSESGDVIWERTYGGSGDEFASSGMATSDGGFVVSATMRSFEGEDVLVMKLDRNGLVRGPCRMISRSSASTVSTTSARTVSAEASVTDLNGVAWSPASSLVGPATLITESSCRRRQRASMA